MKPVEIQDERGWPWIIFDEDAGHHLVRELNKIGCTEIVLPRSAILTGIVGEPTKPNVAVKTDNAAVREVLRRSIRQYDCMLYLWGLNAPRGIDGDGSKKARRGKEVPQEAVDSAEVVL